MKQYRPTYAQVSQDGEDSTQEEAQQLPFYQRMDDLFYPEEQFVMTTLVLEYPVPEYRLYDLWTSMGDEYRQEAQQYFRDYILTTFFFEGEKRPSQQDAEDE
jgi:hypothetical protein